MKKNFIIISLFALLIIVNNAYSKNSIEKPVARKGVIDLENWDISKKGPITLDGEWEFYWENMILPYNPHDLNANYINIPGYWYNYKYNDKYLPQNGYATYQLKIINNKINKNIAIYTRDVGSSFDMYINGKKVQSTGKIGASSASNIPWMQPNIFIFNNEHHKIKKNKQSKKIDEIGVIDGIDEIDEIGEIGEDKKIIEDHIEITLHIANYHYIHGGILQSIYFGTQKDILELKSDNLAFEYFLFGCILIIGIYHLSLFLIRREDKSPLYFAIFCLLISIFATLTGERYLFFKIFSTRWEVMTKILCSSIYLSIPVFIMYMYSIYPDNFSKNILYFLNAISIVFLFLSLILPSRIHLQFLNYYQYLIFFGCIYGYYVLIMSILQKRKDAWIFLFGYALITTAAINDMLNLNMAFNTESLMPYGLLAFIITQTILLSNRLSKTFNDIENLSNELKDLNLNLEKKVQNRTEELHAAMDQLLVMNESIIQKNKRLESAQEDAMLDMDMAAYVQTNFLPKKVPESDEWDIAYYFKPLSGVSGDFYDFYIKDGKFHGLGLFDVSGHGISSGLVTMVAKSTIFRNFIQNTKIPLNEVLAGANAELKSEVKNVDYHITGVLLKFNDENWINYSNAGHPDLLVRSKSIVFPIRNINNNDISGIYLGEPHDSNYESKYEEISFKVEQDDFLLLFTDCLVENENPEGEQFGEERLIEAFRNAPPGSAQRVLGYIIEKFYRFIDLERNQSDDLTMIVLKKLK